jgi:Protein similar to CwfJ C-terminus 1
VISETYLTLAKGGLVPGHLILVPVGHFSCTRQLELFTGEKAIQSKAVLEDITKVTDAVTKSLKDQVLVTFEVFKGSNATDREVLHHMHIQVHPPNPDGAITC